jgi:hypothetical protein
VLTSPSFDEGGAIPVRHSCDGTDISPELDWEGAPQGTVSFALIVDDPDARGFIHWVVYNIPGGSSGSLREGMHPNDSPAERHTSLPVHAVGAVCSAEPERYALGGRGAHRADDSHARPDDYDRDVYAAEVG